MAESNPNTDTVHQNNATTNQVSPPTNGDAAKLFVDLNQADVKTLMTLPGIGEKMAERIIHYRETVRPFQSPVEITTVQGISMAMYQELAARLTVSAPDTSTIEERSTSATSTPNVKEIKVETTDQVSHEGTADEGYLLMWGEQSAEDKPAKTAPAESEDREETYVIETSQPSNDPTNFRRPWILMVVGALLGAFIALALMYAVNGGTLRIADHPKVVGLESELGALKQREFALTETMETLRAELSQYETLNTQLQSSKAEIEVLKQSRDNLTGQINLLEAENKALATQTATLEQKLSSAAQQIATLEEDTDRFDGFLSGLRDLLSVDSDPVPTVEATPTN